MFPHSFLFCSIFLFSTLVATIFASANGSKLMFPHSFLFCSVFKLSILFDCSGFSLIMVLLSGIHEKFKLFTRLILSLTGFSSFWLFEILLFCEFSLLLLSWTLVSNWISFPLLNCKTTEAVLKSSSLSSSLFFSLISSFFSSKTVSANFALPKGSKSTLSKSFIFLSSFVSIIFEFPLLFSDIIVLLSTRFVKGFGISSKLISLFGCSTLFSFDLIELFWILFKLLLSSRILA